MFFPDNFTAEISDERGGQTIQFTDAQGNDQFQVSAWPYQDLVLHADSIEPISPSHGADQPDELDTVHAFQNPASDLFEITFIKNGISYLVQTSPEKATATFDILKSWQFIQ